MIAQEITVNELLSIKKSHLEEITNDGNVKIEQTHRNHKYITQIQLWANKRKFVARKSSESAKESLHKAYKAILTQWDKRMKRKAKYKTKKLPTF